MLKNRGIIRLYKRVRYHLIGIAITAVMNKHIFTNAQSFEIEKWTGLAIGLDDMCGEQAVPLQRRISGSIQPSDLILQPGNIPALVLLLHAQDLSFYPKDGNRKGQGCYSVRR